MVNRQQMLASSNSHIYASFAGAGANSLPNANADLSEANIMWWDDERIDATVTRQYVASKLHPDEAARLDQPLRFGDGLTDDTYLGWIEAKAKKIFLILVELGVPDQIFGVIDDSWDDDDLPIPLDQVERLQLTPEKDPKLEKKFFQRQFTYLLRHIQKGDHVIYDDEELVPLETEHKRIPGAISPPTWGENGNQLDKVHLPGKPDELFYRRRIPLGGKAGFLPPTELLSGIEEMRAVEHEHLTTLWASYEHEGCGYLLLTPVQDSNLKAVLTVLPQSLKIMAKLDRRTLLLNWMHCLVDALRLLHSKGVSHRNIKPSTVMLDIDNHIFLSDIGIFPGGEKKGFDKETYDYSAPEQAQVPPKLTPSFPNGNGPPGARSSIPGGGRRSMASTGGNGSSMRDSAIYTPSNNDTASIHTTSTGSGSSSSGAPPSLLIKRSTFNKHDPQKADMFSLGAIFLEIITIFLKRSSSSFRSHRADKNKTPGRGGGVPDASFHKNMGQVESWMAILARDASKKEDQIFRGIKPTLALVREMMVTNPDERKDAQHIQKELYKILIENCGLGASGRVPSRIHCDEMKVLENAGSVGYDDLRLASQRAAAEACAAVAPLSAEVRSLALGNGGMIYGIEKKVPVYEGAADAGSVKSKSSDGKGSKGSGGFFGKEKGGQSKPKAKAWQAPVYAGMCSLTARVEVIVLTKMSELSFG